jgi:cytoskeletal protein RodZ
MSRIDVVASSRPQQAGGAPKRSGGHYPRALPRLLVFPAAMVFAAALAAPALAAEPTGGYGQTPTTPTKTTPTTTTPTTTTSPSHAATPTSSSGTSAAKESTTSTAAKEAPATTSAVPSSTATKESTLPFTGLDLRWVIAVGVLLIGAGFSILLVQRRHRAGRDPSSR